MQNEKIPTRRFEQAAGEGVFEELRWWREIGEERAPGCEFGFAGALDHDVEELSEAGEKAEDGGEKRRFLTLPFG